MFTSLPLLGLFNINVLGTSLPMVALAAVAVYAVARFAFRRDEAIEDRRRKAIKLAGDCQKNGLDFLAPLLEDYSVGDYSGLLHRLRSFADDIREDATRRQMLDRFFTTQLELRLKDEGERRKIREAVAAVAGPQT